MSPGWIWSGSARGRRGLAGMGGAALRGAAVRGTAPLPLQERAAGGGGGPGAGAGIGHDRRSACSRRGRGGRSVGPAGGGRGGLVSGWGRLGLWRFLIGEGSRKMAIARVVPPCTARRLGGAWPGDGG